MKSKSFLAWFITLILISALVGPTFATFGRAQASRISGQDNRRPTAARKSSAARIVNRYREGGSHRDEQGGKNRSLTLGIKQERPQWVEQAFRRSLDQLQLQVGKEKYGVRDAEAEFRLLEATQDERGHTDVRLSQMHNGVEVYGGQLVSHLDDKNSLRAISGRSFEVARIDTTPKIDDAQAIWAAMAVFDSRDQLAQEPKAKLVILPHKIIKGNSAGATLVYKVTMKLTEGDSQQLFISAEDGHVVWRTNNRHNVVGLGAGLYNNVAPVNTTPNEDGTYTLKDPDRGESQVFDANDNFNTNMAIPFTRDTNGWGNAAAANRENAAVDAHFGVAQSWDYFLNRHGLNGPDGLGTAVNSYVHYRTKNDFDNGVSTNNAFGANNLLRFGDGDGATNGPFVSLDVVSHEFTHCVIDGIFPSDDDDDGMVYAGESGAIEESFADIFGTAVEFFTGASPDYLIGEDIRLSGVANDAMRDMSDPQRLGHPDNFANRLFPGACTPIGDPTDPGYNDFCGVHSNSSIMNHAFYLMAVGGTHRNGTYVPPIGREVAEEIFFIALGRWLTPSSTFRDVAQSTRYVAADYYTADIAASVELAWLAVGVFTDSDLYYSAMHKPALSQGRIILYEPATGFGETGGLNYENGVYQNLKTYSTMSTGWTHIVSMGGPLFYFNAATAQAAVAEIDYEGNQTRTHSFSFYYPPLGKRPYYTHVVWLGGWDIYFYDKQTGKDLRIQITPGGYQTVGGSLSPGIGWTNVVNAQGHTLFYRKDTGSAMVVTGGQKKRYTFAPFWSHIVDGGLRSSGDQTGILFYNTVTGYYVVGDIDGAGNFTTRVSDRWAYSYLRAGWSHIVRVQEGLFFYDSLYGDTMTGFVLTDSESNRFGKEPFQVIPESYGYVASLRTYQLVGAGLATAP